jgi:hypothetical protein
MLEQAKSKVNSATFKSTGDRRQAEEALLKCVAELRALGADVSVADSGTAGSVAGAMQLARDNVAAQSFPGKDVKGYALDRIDLLAAQLASLGLT